MAQNMVCEPVHPAETSHNKGLTINQQRSYNPSLPLFAFHSVGPIKLQHRAAVHA